jgi:F420H(2)-dependent quinone reductase
MRRTKTLTRIAAIVNKGVAYLINSPRWGRLMGRSVVMMTYTGRRSGHTFTTPVGYRRKDDEITIVVALPDVKTWWRNFLGTGAPLTLRLDGVERSGHAVVQRDHKGRVTVLVRLDAPDAPHDIVQA